MVEANIRQIYQIEGNQPLLLKELKSAWSIHSGAIAIFAVTVEDGQIRGNRYHLFDLAAGSALFGVGEIEDLEGNCARSLLAVALEETELVRLDLNRNPSQVRPQIANWVEHLSLWLQGKSELGMHQDAVYATPGSHYLSLLEDGVLLSEADTVWVKLQQGCMRWMGNADLKLNSVSPVFPLTKGMWLAAETEVELYTSTIEEIAVDDAVDSLIRLHQYFFQYFSIINRQETEREYERFQARNQLNSQQKGTAIASLVSVLQPKAAEPLIDGTPLLIAVGAVGRAMGIKVLPPAKSEDLSRLKNPLDAIARASGFPIRQVILSGNWWQDNSEALLGYMLATGEPIALLPNKSAGYFLFDPSQKTKVEIDAAIAETISPEAYTLYRPLPKLVSKPIEVLKFAIRGYEWDAISVIILGVVVSLLGMVTPQATAILINNAIPDGDRLLLWQMGLGLIAVAFGTTGFELAKGIITLRVENVADSNLQLAVWDRMLKLSPAFFRRYSTGDLIGRVMSVTQIRSELSGATQRTLLSGVFALLNLALMLFYSWKLALVAVGITIVMVSVTTASSAIIIRKSRRLEELAGDIEGLTVQLINGVAKLRVAAAEGRAFATWANQYSRTTKLNSQIRQINDTVSVVSTMLSLISSILIFWFAVWFINSALDKGLPGLSLGAFLAFNSAYGTFFSGVSDLSNVGTDILGIVPLWERAQPILKSTIESDSDKADPGRLTGQIATDRLTFRYREDGPLILEDISLRIEPGEFVAFVGASGSGKSTLFRLLLGFETPISGTVYYDNQDLAGLNIQAVRRQFGVVLQSGRIGAGSVFDNITSGALATFDEAWTAAKMAGFAEDIEQMPMGMHTVVSEGGTNLSGGQRQRLLIARALISRPKILLMDEATSALDNKTQAIVSQSIDRLDTTRIVIAHRLSTIRNADRIYVLEGGRIVQTGRFEELIEQDGLFARLVARQLE